MLGLEITRNGKKTIVAGGDAVISLAAVMAVYGKLSSSTLNEAAPFGNLTVLGVSEAKEDKKQSMITWEEEKDVKLGDEITIRFIEIDKPSRPSEITEVESDETE